MHKTRTGSVTYSNSHHFRGNRHACKYIVILSINGKGCNQLQRTCTPPLDPPNNSEGKPIRGQKWHYFKVLQLSFLLFLVQLYNIWKNYQRLFKTCLSRLKVFLQKHCRYVTDFYITSYCISDLWLCKSIH